MGTVTTNLARLNNWDQVYIAKIQSLHKMENYDVNNWMNIITKYLGRSEENANDAKEGFNNFLQQNVKQLIKNPVKVLSRSIEPNNSI